jgi:hypothetical protein
LCSQPVRLCDPEIFLTFARMCTGVPDDFMRYLLTILLGLIFLTTQAQTTISNDTIHWRESRPLTWDDFKGEAIEGIGLTGEAFCMNAAGFKKPNAFQKSAFDVVAMFDRAKSWMDPKAKSDEGLMFFQIMFNIYEVHARSLRKDLATSKFPFDPSALFQEKYNASMTNLTNEFNEFRRETKLGTDSDALKRWKIKVDEELNTLDEYKQ